MSLLDDARQRLTEYTEHDRPYACGFCGEFPPEHDPDCQVPYARRIVAALEAADRVIEGTNAYDNYGRMLVDMDDYDALVAALRGEVVPSNVRRIDTSGPLTPY